MPVLCQLLMLRWWNSRFIATKRLQALIHAIGGQFKLLRVHAKDSTSIWIQLEQACRPSSQRNPNTKVSNSSTTSEAGPKWMTGMRTSKIRKNFGHLTSKKECSKSPEPTKQECLTRSRPITATAMPSKGLANHNSARISELCSVIR